MTDRETEQVAADVLANFPPVVYVPTVEDGQGQMRVDLKRTKTGQVAIFCYSAIDRLEKWFGSADGWVLVTPEGLEEINKQTPFDILLLDKRLTRPDPHEGPEQPTGSVEV